MTIAFDKVTSPASEGDFETGANPTTSHVPTGTAAGIVVLLGENDDAVGVTLVSWGGVSLTEITGSPQTISSEALECSVWFNGDASALAARSNDTVSITGGAVSRMIGVATFTAAGDVEIVDIFASNDISTGPSGTLSLGGETCAAVQIGVSGVNSGGGGDMSGLTDWSLEGSLVDFGSQSGQFWTFDNIASIDITCGFTQNSDEWVCIALAVKDAGGGSIIPQVMHHRRQQG